MKQRAAEIQPQSRTEARKMLGEKRSDADFTLVDLKAGRAITNDWIASKVGWTAYDGREVTGWPMGTIIRGRTAMFEGELRGEASGRPVLF